MSHDASNEKLSTRAISAGRPLRAGDSALNAPISLNSTFTAGGPIGYGRYGNETWSATESAISALEGGSSLIFSSGMAAITAAFSTLPLGARVIASHQGYSGVMTLLKQYGESGRLKVVLVDVANTDEVLAALPGADLLWLESPTNPCLDVAELPQLISAAKAAGILVMVDNTFATALTQRPLHMGADVVMNSVTKFLSGHSDVLLGSLSTENSELLVARVRYPGLVGDSQHERAKKFMETYGAVLSFEILGSATDADRVCESSSIITHATSLGGVETLWERRRRWPSESPSVPENLIRLSVGCEDVEDLWEDIQKALAAI